MTGLQALELIKDNIKLEYYVVIKHDLKKYVEYGNLVNTNRRKQKEGIAKAKAKGVSFGRKRIILTSTQISEINFQIKNPNKKSLRVSAKDCGLPYSTFYKYYLLKKKEDENESSKR